MAVAVLILWIGDFFVQARLNLSDVVFVPRATSGSVVIVAIDDRTLAAFGQSVAAWPRSVHGELVRHLSAAGARVIFFDILFAEPSAEDEVFAEAIAAARDQSAMRTRTILPLVDVDQGGTRTGNGLGLLGPVAALRDESSALCHANVPFDLDGTVRRQPVRVGAGGDPVFACGIVSYLSYIRIPSSAFAKVVAVDKKAVHLAGARRIPVDDQQQMTLFFFGAPGDGTFPVYSYADVVAGNVGSAPFHDKIVLVGLMNQTGAVDTYSVPLGTQGRQMAGVEIHANAVETILLEMGVQEQDRFSQALTIVLLALAASLLYGLVSRSWLWLAAIVAASVLIWLLAAFASFNLYLLKLNLFHSMLALVLPAPVTLGVTAVGQARRRRRAEFLLGSLVDASGQSLDLERIAPMIAQDLSQFLKSDQVEIWIWNPAQQDLALTHRQQAEWARFPAPAKEEVLRALKSDELTHEAGWLYVPLRWQSDPLGVLVARVGQLQQTAQQTLALFTLQTTALLANAALLREAQSLSALKTRMIRMVSHDLRNPLSVILGYTELLLEELLLEEEKLGDAPAPPNLQDYLAEIERAARTMLGLVNSILTLERERQGGRQSVLYDLPAVLHQAAAAQRGSMVHRHQRFHVQIPDRFPHLAGDADQIGRAVVNLLDNATKYTPPGGDITLTLEQRDGWAKVTVTDTGAGIPEAAQEQIFAEFYRVPTADAESIPGTGLGLSLVKASVEGHGGRVWVESQPGQGSVFGIELPLA